ncbi:peptidase S41 [Alkalilimnicola ehrlichii]|uniref:Peptidase S41 n=2 Tax=Alkalilimnicola ehrlichii TaxID=351052 RepID=A0A3E0WPG9_9GAMM|nr:peptidase S41 [Alkalilimnicola ehrlichii]RFA34874.1 peptidase S41 [Alkalilimnicola ehrlichii]
MKWMRNRYRGLIMLSLLVLLTPLAGHVQSASDDAANGKVGTPLAPEPIHIQKARLVSDLLSQHHYRTQIIDDKLSQTVFDAYLDALDRDRYYFLAEDIEDLSRYRNRLDSSFRRGELTAAYQIFNRYQKRVKERVSVAKAILNDGLEGFADDDRIELDRSEAKWAKTSEELDELWRKRVQHDALTLRLADQEWDRVKEILTARYERLARAANEHSPEDVFEIYMNAWANTFDPHTAYMSPRLSENFDIHMRLSLEGIGAVLRSEHDMTEVVELVPGGPAAENGRIQPGDRILAVGQGKDGELEDVVGWRLQDVVDLIRGPKESVVRIQVLPSSGDTTPRVVELVRNEVKLEAQAAQSKVLETGTGDDKQRIGVIKLPTFYMDFQAADAGDRNYRSTTRDVRRLIAELEEDGGIDGLVIDLRGNGGGSLREATELTGLFLPGAPVVQVRRSSGDVEILRDSSSEAVYDGPLAVMVDRFSASASEIFAAAIQDHGRGIIVGQQTFGKGTVQNLVDLDHFGLRSRDPAGRLKLTIAKFYRVSGGSTQQRGVVPDITLPSPVSPDEFGEDAVGNALPWGEIRAVSFRRERALDTLLPALRERHESRSAEDKAFQALLDEYAYLRSLQRVDSAPLTEKARRAERDRLQAERLEYINRRREIYGLEKLDSIEHDLLDKMPDTLLETAATIVADLRDLASLPAADIEKTLQARGE